jgi:hypothetical protein
VKRENYKRLEFGTSRTEIERILGPPDNYRTFPTDLADYHLPQSSSLYTDVFSVKGDPASGAASSRTGTQASWPRSPLEH